MKTKSTKPASPAQVADTRVKPSVSHAPKTTAVAALSASVHTKARAVMTVSAPVIVGNADLAKSKVKP